jgi:phosphoribosylamine--glycine ligase
VQEITRTILQPALDGMRARGTPYVGVLYAGVMLTEQGPMALEYNCRLGDPETQVLLPLIPNLLDLLVACTRGNLAQVPLQLRPGACATVVLAAPGYPGAYPTGLPIQGLEQLAEQADVIAFHAGTARKAGQLVTAGGRVLAVSGLGADLPSALARAYAGVAQVQFDGMHYRRDIGKPNNVSFHVGA